MDGPPLKDTSAAERRSIWLNYAVLLYTVVAFAAMLFVANAIISTFNIRWDLTPQKQFSLSDFDKRVLAGLTHNVKVMAGMGTILPLLFFWILNWNEAAFTNSWLELVRSFSLFDQFGGFAKGVIDLAHVTYFIFFIVFFLFLTQRSMEARKWMGRR